MGRGILGEGRISDLPIPKLFRLLENTGLPNPTGSVSGHFFFFAFSVLAFLCFTHEAPLPRMKAEDG